MNPEEKTILLGALFHDIGKFSQCCSVSMKKSHPDAGAELLVNLKLQLLPLLDGNEIYFKKLCDIVMDHHTPQSVIHLADKISANVGTEKELETEKSFADNFPFLTSVFSSVRLSSKKEIPPHFYNQCRLDSDKTQKITSISSDSTNLGRYNEDSLKEFSSELRQILSCYGSIRDFASVFSLILKLLENWLWCVPDYTNASHSDISLYNHLRDTAGFAHVIYRTEEGNGENRQLVLIVCDLSDMQKYIVNMQSKKPVNILRGRSIFLQAMNSIFTQIFIRNFNLTDSSIIMNDGGKFYILVPGTADFEVIYKKTIIEIDSLLSANFDFDLKLASGYTKFDYHRLARGEFGFGKIIQDASFELERGRNRMFESTFFDDFNEQKFVLDVDFISPIEGTTGTDSIKCEVTNKPIKKGRDRQIQDEYDSFYTDQQVLGEYHIGGSDPQKPLVCSIKLTGSNFDKVKVNPLEDFIEDDVTYNVIINASIKQLIAQLQQKSSDQIFRLFKNTSYIGIANFASTGKKSNSTGGVMSFEEMVESNKGAKLLTFINGDVDNLDLILATGLNSRNSASQTTTMNHQLKYFFSTGLNSFLTEKCESGDKRALIVSAYGDELMLITPQSSFLTLLNSINDKFSQFVCSNPEIHLSFCVTHFKHSTPIMFIAGYAEDNLRKIKRNFKNPGLSKSIQDDSFQISKDKSVAMIFGTPIKSDRIGEFMEWEERIMRWINLSPKPLFTIDAIKYILKISKLMDEYYVKKNSAALIWHPRLSYYIRKNLNPNYNFEDVYEGEYYKKFISQILSIEKDDEFDLKNILHPLMNSVILRFKN